MVFKLTRISNLGKRLVDRVCATWAYDIFFRRPRRRAAGRWLQFILLISSAVCYGLGVVYIQPVLELDQMTKTTGVVERITGRGGCTDKLYLRVGDQLKKYNVCLDDGEEQLILGQVATVWSQHKFWGFYWVDKIYQLQIGNRLVEDQRQYKKNSMNARESMLTVILVSGLAVILSLIALWLMGIESKRADVEHDKK